MKILQSQFIKSDYEDITFFLSGIYVGALAFYSEKSTNELHPLVVNEIMTKSEDPENYAKKICFIDSDMDCEVITDNDCYFVGMNDIKSNDLKVISYC